MYAYAKKYGFKFSSSFEGVLLYHAKKSWNKYVNDDNKDLATPLAIDLL